MEDMIARGSPNLFLSLDVLQANGANLRFSLTLSCGEGRHMFLEVINIDCIVNCIPQDCCKAASAKHVDDG